MKPRQLAIAVVLLLTLLLLPSCGVSQKQVDAIADELIETQKALENCKGEANTSLLQIADAAGIFAPEDKPKSLISEFGLLTDEGYQVVEEVVRVIHLSGTFSQSDGEFGTSEIELEFETALEKCAEEKEVLNQKAADEFTAAQRKYEEEMEAVRKEYEERIAAAEKEYEEALADFNKVAYHLAYEVMESEWLAGNVEGEYAVTNMKKQLVGLGNDELLSLWEAYLAAETEQENMEKALEFNTAYYREMNELMDSVIEKYGILGY
ncbi:hypothetical protein ACFLXJ_02720 [Chloroflexota bacterium]